VPVPVFLIRLLASEIADRDHAQLVFPSARGGGFLTLGQARYAFTKATNTVDGAHGVRLHDLRHTCASLAISSGANVKVVQRLLGHKTAVLTLDRYGHLFPDDLDAVADAFDTAADALRTINSRPSQARRAASQRRLEAGPSTAEVDLDHPVRHRVAPRTESTGPVVTTADSSSGSDPPFPAVCAVALAPCGAVSISQCRRRCADPRRSVPSSGPRSMSDEARRGPARTAVPALRRSAAGPARHSR
jgi:hypothetical protein